MVKPRPSWPSTGADVVTGPHDSWAGRFDRPQRGFAPPDTVLREGDPVEAGLDPRPVRDAERFLADCARDDGATGHPRFSGAAGLLAHNGVIVDRHAVGGAVRYADAAGTELPADRQVPVRPDTIFDLASITKLFTSIAVMDLVERGTVDLDLPVARYLPGFASNGKRRVTVRELLTHTSGLDAEPSPALWRGYADIPSRRAAVLNSPLASPPGTTYLYSDINLMALGFLVEQLTGSTLDAVVGDRITGPLGMVDTGFTPPASKLDRIAATEDQSSPPRGMLRGQVHDENAWALGGVAGHAGIFSTAGDLAILAQTILNGGIYRGARVLRPGTVGEMLTNHNTAFPAQPHGLGFELDQTYYMGALSSPETAGHTGYTGTTLVVDPGSRSIAILLTNRVHPARNRGPVNLARERWGSALAHAMAVYPVSGSDAWFSDTGNLSDLGDTGNLGGAGLGSATLTTRPLSPRGPVQVSFDAFVDTAMTAPLVLESSTDGTTWQPVPVRAEGPGAPAGPIAALSGRGHRSWWRMTAELPAASRVILRWRHTAVTASPGRGVYVDGVRITSRDEVLVDADGNASSLSATGWITRSR